jgi:hypothetical protein
MMRVRATVVALVGPFVQRPMASHRVSVNGSGRRDMSVGDAAGAKESVRSARRVLPPIYM